MDVDLAAVVGDAIGAPVTVRHLTRLSGGASRETWSFDAVRPDGTVEELILRRDPPGARRPGGMALEARVLRAAARADVPVPAIVTTAEVGSPGIVMRRIAGETIARRILRDDAFAAARPLLAAQCGEILARLHRVAPDEVGELEEHDQVAQYRDALDALGEPHPAFELGLRWLESHRPARTPTRLVHGDFRNGNLIVGPEGIRAVLDWELAHAGDPMEDLGWLCTRAWRFGSELPVGGFGTYEQLIDAYQGAGGGPVDRDALRWWEVLGSLKWGVMCIMQAATHLTGAVRSVELAAIGRRVCENEWDVLQLISGGRPAPAPPAGDLAASGGGPHDAPDLGQLVEAVREFLERDVMGATSGRVQFHTRVAVNVLGIVGRQLAQGPAQKARHGEGLAALGFGDDAALAKAIRSGDVDDRIDEVTAFVVATVRDKLEVANPRYAGSAVTFPVV